MRESGKMASNTGRVFILVLMELLEKGSGKRAKESSGLRLRRIRKMRRKMKAISGFIDTEIYFR